MRERERERESEAGERERGGGRERERKRDRERERERDREGKRERERARSDEIRSYLGVETSHCKRNTPDALYVHILRTNEENKMNQTMKMEDREMQRAKGYPQLRWTSNTRLHKG